MTQNDKIKEAVELLISNEADPSTILQKGGLLKQLTKSLVERVLKSEIDDHLGYEKHDRSSISNSRNGLTSKKFITEQGPVDISSAAG